MICWSCAGTVASHTIATSCSTPYWPMRVCVAYSMACIRGSSRKSTSKYCVTTTTTIWSGHETLNFVLSIRCSFPVIQWNSIWPIVRQTIGHPNMVSHRPTMNRTNIAIHDQQRARAVRWVSTLCWMRILVNTIVRRRAAMASKCCCTIPSNRQKSHIMAYRWPPASKHKSLWHRSYHKRRIGYDVFRRTCVSAYLKMKIICRTSSESWTSRPN